MTTVNQSRKPDISETPEYLDTTLKAQRDKEDRLIARALKTLYQRLETPKELLSSAKSVREYLQLKLMHRESEVFCCLFLDNQHRLLDYREVFHGTIDGCSVYPREVVKLALQRNAAAVILAHNHPSGVAEPSQADMRITERLTAALELIDVRVLDHLIVGNACIVSFAEQGLLI